MIFGARRQLQLLVQDSARPRATQLNYNSQLQPAKEAEQLYNNTAKLIISLRKVLKKGAFGSFLYFKIIWVALRVFEQNV